MNASPRTDDLERYLDEHPASPLFARLAERLLKAGEVTRAISLCERGLRHFPEYPTGHLIHASCLAARTGYGEALRSIDRVIEAYPGNIILEEIRSDWSDLSGGGNTPVTPLPEEDPGTVEEHAGRPDGAFVLPPSPAAETTVPVAPPAPGTPAEVSGPRGGTTLSVTAEGRITDTVPGERPGMMEIAGEDPEGDVRTGGTSAVRTTAGPAGTGLSSTREKTFTGFIVENKIVSRTLAEIYASQGAIAEAVNTYRLLVAGVPDRREMYEERLKELEDRLGAEPGAGNRPAD